MVPGTSSSPGTTVADESSTAQPAAALQPGCVSGRHSSEPTPAWNLDLRDPETTTMRPIRNLTLLLLVVAMPAAAQETRKAPAPARQTPPAAQPAATLKQVRDAHAAADADRSGALSASEAVGAGVEAAAF